MTTTKTLLLINSDPSLPIAEHAFRYAKAYLELQSKIGQSNPELSNEVEDTKHALSIFFYADAAHTANGLRWQTSDRENLTQLWSQLSHSYNIELPVCVSTALTRGVTDQDNAKRHRLDNSNLAEGFVLVGLGELAEQLRQADKVISF